MSVKARDATLKILADRGYSGVLSGHEWSDKHNYKQILALGGMVGGRADNVENFADDWATYRQVRSPDYFFGWGFGPDANGLGSLPSPSQERIPSPTRSPPTAATSPSTARSAANERSTSTPTGPPITG